MIIKYISFLIGVIWSYSIIKTQSVFSKKAGIIFKIFISKVEGAMDEMIKKANGKRTIPQIFFDDQHIGGYDEVRALEKENNTTNFF